MGKNTADLHTDINEFKKCYYPETNLIENKKGDLLANIHNILFQWVEELLLSATECT
jgi:hypothetical protein